MTKDGSVPHVDKAVRCPLYPQERTFSEAGKMSAKCQKRTSHRTQERRRSPATARVAEVPVRLHAPIKPRPIDTRRAHLLETMCRPPRSY